MNEAAEFVNNTRAIRTAINESKKKRRRSSSNGGSSSNKTPPKEKKVKRLINDALKNGSRGLTSVNDKKTGKVELMGVQRVSWIISANASSIYYWESTLIIFQLLNFKYLFVKWCRNRKGLVLFVNKDLWNAWNESIYVQKLKASANNNITINIDELLGSTVPDTTAGGNMMMMMDTDSTTNEQQLFNTNNNQFNDGGRLLSQQSSTPSVWSND